MFECKMKEYICSLLFIIEIHETLKKPVFNNDY